MRKILLVTFGGAVGYVLGARAGRPAYDRIVDRWTGFASAVGIEDLAITMKEAGIDVRDSAVERASGAVSTSARRRRGRAIRDGHPEAAERAATAPKRTDRDRQPSVGEDGTALDQGVRR